MRIVIASGKGGTGKTTVATSLALVLGKFQTVNFLDCDVEAPNAHLYLHPKIEETKTVNLLIPQVDPSRCNACGRCGEVCEYHAIVNLGKNVLVFPQLCHGCGSCVLNCPEDAIREIPSPLGVLEYGRTPEGIHFARGILNIGEPMAVPVIRQLKKWRAFEGLTICDAPPGVSCPVVETLRLADYALLVTEPTPFGLHDLRAAAKVVGTLQIPAGVIVNRDGVDGGRMAADLEQIDLPVLMRIPDKRQIAEALARGETLVSAFPEYIPRFRDLLDQITSEHQMEALV